MPRPLRAQLAALLVVAASVAVPAISGSPTAAAAACGSSPTSNGTGYRPPSAAASLPQGHRPGPELLYRPLASSPQLDNAGPWRAQPILVSGTRSYRSGELVYQDFLYDDRALAYPSNARYAGNAADLVEVRLRLLPTGLGVRLSYNSMVDPQLVAATVALGSSSAKRPLPHGAGAVSPGEVFVTVHGCTGDAVRASDGRRLGAVSVASDLRRRQVDVVVPYAVFNPRSRASFRVAAASGLWDTARGAYLRPDAARPAFFNVAFRTYGPWTQNTWHDEQQNAALAAGDITPFSATVDVAKLRSGVRDDLTGQAGGVPRSGPMNRIHVSRFEPAQGRGNNTSGGGIVVGYVCDPPACTPQYSGRLQPYTVYVPALPAPAGGYGLVVNLHGANSNHNHHETGGPGIEMWRVLAEDGGRPSIMVLPNARGTTYFYQSLARADVFEVWADAAARYRLEPRHVVQSGSSMGGYGTYLLASLHPDLFRAAFPNVGLTAATRPQTPQLASDADSAERMLPSLRHVPVLSTQGLNDPVVPISSTRTTMQSLDSLGYRYDYWFVESAESGGHTEYRHFVEDRYLRLTSVYPPTIRDPHRVTYVVNDEDDSDTRYGLRADSAYWLSGMRVRDASAVFGQVDVLSHGFGRGDPRVGPMLRSAGASRDGSGPFQQQQRGWGPSSTVAVADRLVVTATNVASVVVDVARARVSCSAAVSATSDGPMTVTLRGNGCARTVAVGG